MISFFRGLGALQVTLRKASAASKTVLGSLWTSQTFKKYGFARFLGRHLFAALELLLALRGLS